MSGVRLLVGTRKGGFVLTSDDKRQKWDISGPHFTGWEIYHMKGSPVDPDRLYCSQSSGWFGQQIQRSDDGGKTWAPVGNEFAYDGVPGTHQWYDGTQHPWEFKRVWHLEPSLTDPDTVYAGVEDAALFKTTDGGKSWSELSGLRAHGSGPSWMPGAGGMCLHTILLDPSNPNRIYIAISAAGAFRTDDGGTSWKPINKGLYSQYNPNPTAEVGHCVHRIALHPSRPEVLFMQKHWDVMRSDDAGDQWTEVSGNLPTDFGFPIDVHAHEPETIYVVPIKSDSEHIPLDGKLRVYRSRTGGNEWEALTNGLPQSDCYVNVLREAMCVDSLDSCGVYFGTTAGRSTVRPTAAIRGRQLCATSRRFSPSRSRHCHDPRRTPVPSAHAGAHRRRRGAHHRRTGHAAVGPRCAGVRVPGPPRHDPRSRQARAAAVDPLLRLQSRLIARATGRTAPGRGCGGRRAIHGRRRDCRRLKTYRVATQATLPAW